MAVDTARKRASALGVGRPYLRLVIPTGTIDQFARENIADSYGGILAASPPVVDACVLGLVSKISPELGLEGAIGNPNLFLVGNISPELGQVGQIGNENLFLVGKITPELGLTGPLCT